jgi:putative nucleotidyltransferase with HDIG domain
LLDYRDQIKPKLPPSDILLTYALYHDCGKPFCRIIDEDGKQHFPNHAEISAKIWRENGGDEQIARLIQMDMDIHLLKAHQIDEFCQRTECISLLLSGLAEVHANAKMFGGIESISFKIKWKHIEKRGRQICKIIFP